MTDEHKAALATGRQQGLAVRRYLEALQSNKPKRGRRVSEDSISRQLADIEERLPGADPLNRLHLLQQRKSLEARRDQSEGAVDLSELEAAFVEVAAKYGESKGIDYSTWREAGVPAQVLRRARIGRGAR